MKFFSSRNVNMLTLFVTIFHRVDDSVKMINRMFHSINLSILIEAHSDLSEHSVPTLISPLFSREFTDTEQVLNCYPLTCPSP